MSLCRWSNSPFYIYEVGVDDNNDRVIEVCTFGQFTPDDILLEYNLITDRAKSHGYNIFQRVELYAYLNVWANMVTRKRDYKTSSALLNILRLLGHVRSYVSDPYSDGPLADLNLIQSYLRYLVDYVELKVAPEYHAVKQTNKHFEVEKYRKQHRRSA